MSTSDTQIVCRNCKETIGTETGSCPQCGTEIRGNLPYAVGIGVGLLLIVAAILRPGDLLAFGVLGAVVAAGAGFFLYDKRQRIEQATERNE